MTRPIEISAPGAGPRVIGGENPCFIIAEIGTNWLKHYRNDDTMARSLIENAAHAGCDAVKFQTFAPERVYVPNPGESDYLKDAGINRSIVDILSERTMPIDMIPGLAKHAADCGLFFMSSCFSVGDIGLIDDFVSIHKLASYEISHPRLIESLAKTGKPLIISTGASEPSDVEWAVGHFRANGGKRFALLQCTARYPAPDTAMNIRVMQWLQQTFDCEVGLSDHSPTPLSAPITAVALGAKILEKHFTYDKSADGPDHFNSLTSAELRQMVTAVRSVEAMIGDGVKRIEPAEEELAQFAKRRLQAISDIAPGEPLVEGRNFDILRPGKRSPGLHPRYISEIQGRRARRAIAASEGITRDAVED